MAFEGHPTPSMVDFLDQNSVRPTAISGLVVCLIYFDSRLEADSMAWETLFSDIAQIYARIDKAEHFGY